VVALAEAKLITLAEPLTVESFEAAGLDIITECIGK
jgi:hypothetical protein